MHTTEYPSSLTYFIAGDLLSELASVPIAGVPIGGSGVDAIIVANPDDTSSLAEAHPSLTTASE